MAELNDYEIEKIAGGAPMAVTDETEEDLFARGCKAHIPIDGATARRLNAFSMATCM